MRDKMDLKKYIAIEVYGGKKLPLFKRIYFRYCEPSTNAVFLIRKELHYKEKADGASNVFWKNIMFFKYQYYRIKLVRRYGIHFSGRCSIGIGLNLPHPVGIVIGANKIGDNVTIFQNVTIGGARMGDYLKHNQPFVGNNTILFAGSKVLGNIMVAENTMVAAGAVLNKPTEKNGIYAGVPAKLIGKKE